MELGRNIIFENGISTGPAGQGEQSAEQAGRAVLVATGEGKWSLPAQGYHVRQPQKHCPTGWLADRQELLQSQRHHGHQRQQAEGILADPINCRQHRRYDPTRPGRYHCC